MIDEKKIREQVDADFPDMSPAGRDSVFRSRVKIAKNAGKVLPDLIKVDLGPNASRKVKSGMPIFVSFDTVRLTLDEVHGYVHSRLTANEKGTIQGTAKERKLEQLLAEAAEVAADLAAREALDKTVPK